MHRLHLHFAALVCALLAARLEAAQFKFATQTFSVPDGFEVEQVAGPPVVERPISGSFDEAGRLYVTDSSGSNDKVEKQEMEKPHRVLRLEAADAAGRFSKSTVFAEHLMFPEGCLWYDGALYVSAPPSIWKLGDVDAQGRSQKRWEWHQGKTLTGCANDLHGPYLGLDGWIYWCKGAFARQDYEDVDGKPFTTRASHIFRTRPDHSHLEAVLTAGMDNPVGVAFTLGGERFMCGTFLMQPAGGKRDGIVHAVYGGVFGKQNDVLEGHSRTGDLLPIMTHLGAAAPCSVIRYESQAFGTEYRNNLFVCCFNLHKVTRHILRAEGATFATTDSDFLVSDNPDFHPTDVLEDADGSLLVIDTGGWYKLCCPTSQLSKPDVLGAIYRVRRSATAPVEDPRGLRIDWAHLAPPQLATLLADERPAVRKRALAQTGKTGDSTVPALAQVLHSAHSDEARAEAVWALTRLPAESARAEVRSVLEDSSDLVRHAAAVSAGLWRDTKAVPALIGLLSHANAQLERAAAEALGRIGAKSAIPALLQASAQPVDRILQHSLIYALIEIHSPTETAEGLRASSTGEKQAALIALDQMADSTLQASVVAPLLNSGERQLREAAVWVASHHPEWGDDLAGYYRNVLQKPGPTDLHDLTQQLAEFSGSPQIQGLIGAFLAKADTPAQTKRLLLDAIASASPHALPPGWIGAVDAALKNGDPDILHSALAAARTLNQSKIKAPELAQSLLRLAQDVSRPEDLRVEALSIAPENLGPLDSNLVRLLLSSLDPTKSLPLRTAAASVLAKASLEQEQQLALADQLRGVGPLEATKLLGAFEHCTNEVVGERLVSALTQAKSLSSIRPETLENVLSHFPDSVRTQGKHLLDSLKTDTAQQTAHLDALMQSLGNGNIRRGQAVFNSQKAACSSCHAMGYLGGHVGPDLTSIGQIRTERDLLESIVYPSAGFVRSFEPYVIKTKQDDDYSGVLKKDAPDEVVLATGPTTEVRIARSDIVDMRPGKVSIMPAGLEQQLTRQELIDLVTFLKATKWGAQ